MDYENVDDDTNANVPEGYEIMDDVKPVSTSGNKFGTAENNFTEWLKVGGVKEIGPLASWVKQKPGFPMQGDQLVYINYSK